MSENASTGVLLLTADCQMLNLLLVVHATHVVYMMDFTTPTSSYLLMQEEACIAICIVSQDRVRKVHMCASSLHASRFSATAANAANLVFSRSHEPLSVASLQGCKAAPAGSRCRVVLRIRAAKYAPGQKNGPPQAL